MTFFSGATIFFACRDHRVSWSTSMNSWLLILQGPVYQKSLLPQGGGLETALCYAHRAPSVDA